jgi:hypothetical protein
MREYKYVGPREILGLVGKSLDRCLIQHETDISSWMEKTHQYPNSEGKVTVTFIIDIKGNLWIADRRSEHVVCAVGGPVLSAGEMTFQITKIEVSEVTNQSTGFCPEPESWMSVANALDKIGLVHPNDFTTHFHFRRCDNCDAINIVKENWYVCSACDAELDRAWNFDSNQ